MDGLEIWIQLGTGIVMISNVIGLVLVVYKFSKDPDILMDKQLGINAKACDEKHKRIDEIIVELKDSIKSIDKSVMLIKENDIKHIENEIRRMSDVQTKILTIIEYKEGLKQ
jgi:hypothetical protein